MSAELGENPQIEISGDFFFYADFGIRFQRVIKAQHNNDGEQDAHKTCSGNDWSSITAGWL